MLVTEKSYEEVTSMEIAEDTESDAGGEKAEDSEKDAAGDQEVEVVSEEGGEWNKHTC